MPDPNIPAIRPPSALDLTAPDDDADQTIESTATPTASAGQVSGAAQPLGAASALPPPDLNPFGEGDEGISRWSPELVQQATGVIDRDIARAARDADVSLAEHHSSRGTVGSSIESWSQQEMLTNLETERMRRLTDLNVNMANAFAEDRATAANIAFTQRAQQLQAMGMDQDEAFRQAQLQQQESQFTQTLDWRRDALAQELGFSREQLAQQNEQFSATLADRNTQRLHEMGLQQDQQEWATAESQLNRLLESRALDLQRDALSAEEAWRQADRDLDRELTMRAEELTKEGWSRDDAYRQALIDFDEENLQFQREAQQQNAELAEWDLELRLLIASVVGGMDPEDFPKRAPIGRISGTENMYGSDNEGTTTRRNEDGTTTTVADGTTTDGTRLPRTDVL